MDSGIKHNYVCTVMQITGLSHPYKRLTARSADVRFHPHWKTIQAQGLKRANGVKKEKYTDSFLFCMITDMQINFRHANDGVLHTKIRRWSHRHSERCLRQKYKETDFVMNTNI